MLRWLRFVLELIAGLAGAVIFLGILLVWRLDHSPAAATFLTPPIKAVIDQALPGLHCHIEHTLLEWSNTDLSLFLHADNIDLDNDAGIHVITIPSLDLEVSPFGLLFGHFLPTALKIDHPHIHLVRYSTGKWYFGETNTDDSNYDVQHILENIVDSLAEAHLTRKLEINQADFDVEDRARHKIWLMSAPHIILERRGDDLNGLALIDVSPQESSSSLEVLYHHLMLGDQHDVTVRFHDFIPATLAGGDPKTIGLSQAAGVNIPLTGEVAFSFDNHMQVEIAHMDIHGGAGHVDLPTLWDQPRDIKKCELTLEYNQDFQERLRGGAKIDFDGPQLSLSMLGKAAPQTSQDIAFNLNVQLDDLPLDSFAKIWPKFIIPDPRDWIISSLSKGQLKHGDIDLKGSFSWDDMSNMTLDEGQGKLSVAAARVDYLDGLPIIDDVDANATFDLRHMDIEIEKGHAGNLKITPFVMHIMDLDKNTQTIDIPLSIEGTAGDVLNVLSLPRLSYAQDLGLAPDDITGNIQGTVDLRFPLLKTLAMADVDIKAHANLENIATLKLGRRLPLSQGRVSLDLDKNGFVIEGPVLVNNVAFQVNWRDFFKVEENQPVSVATVTGSLMGDQWALFGVNALAGTRGPIMVSLQIEQTKQAQMNIKASLDMASADVHLHWLNWRKPPNNPGTLTLTMMREEGKPIFVHDLDLEASQTVIKGSATLSSDASQFLSFDFPTFKVGRTNAVLHYSELNDAEHTIKLNAQGVALDLSGIMGDARARVDDPRPHRFDVQLEKLYTSDTGFMTNVKGYAVRDPLGWREIKLNALDQGDSSLDISLSLNDGRRQLLITCDNFGKALHSLGFTSAVENGALKIIGSSTIQEPRVIVGTVKIGSFEVTNLPLLANLMNATSPFGIVDLINKNISFDRLFGQFRWQGDDIDLIKTNLPGSSIGINIEGHVNLDTGQADLHGNLVPFGLVNRFWNYIPVIGDLMTGGKGQGVLAVAYKITGFLANPNIVVNPISLLTPGFVRNLFFGGEDSDDFSPAQEPSGGH